MDIDKEIKEVVESSVYNWTGELDKAVFSAGYRACYHRHVEQPKVVDLSVVAGSNIPMLFAKSTFELDEWRCGYLDHVGGPNKDGLPLHYDQQGDSFLKCKFDTTRPVAWFGIRDCPLPDGVKGKACFRDSSWGALPWTPKCWNWSPMFINKHDVVAFQVTGLAEGWKYPWE